MEAEEMAFLGTGWAFPPSFQKNTHTNEMVSGYTDIEQSIFIILSTIPGERIMQPEFGCNLKKLVFEIRDSAFMNELEDTVAMALLKFEPRINFSGVVLVNADNNDNVLYLRINYTVISTNTRHNIVYPFYINEGTNI